MNALKMILKKNWLLSLVFTSLGIVSCAPPIKTITGPDGTPHKLVSCNSIEACYQWASEACGGKYQIVNTSSQVTTLGKTVSSSTDLLVRCASTPTAEGVVR